jgi:hypothetical protein
MSWVFWIMKMMSATTPMSEKINPGAYSTPLRHVDPLAQPSSRSNSVTSVSLRAASMSQTSCHDLVSTGTRHTAPGLRARVAVAAPSAAVIRSPYAGAASTSRE